MGERDDAAEVAAKGQARLMLRIDATLAERLRAEADDRDVSVNWLCTKLLQEGLERLIPANELRWVRD